jgi:hypothetical protein
VVQVWHFVSEQEPEVTKQSLFLQRLLRCARNDASFVTEKAGSDFVHNPK